MYYFKFEIPLNEDGTRISYCKGWHGTCKCPKNVTVLLYNDEEGYGIAKAEDEYIPKEVIEIKESEAFEIIDKVQPSLQIYKSDQFTKVGFWDSSTIKFKGTPKLIIENEKIDGN